MKKLTALLVAGAVFAAPLSSAYAQACLSQNERDALQVRVLQTELMVATLTCKGGDYSQRYNAFVTKFRDQLADHGKSLKRYFDREHGKAAPSRLDAFVTRIANQLSLRSMNDPNYCTLAGEKLNAAREMPPAQLVHFSKAVADDHLDVSGCRMAELTAKK